MKQSQRVILGVAAAVVLFMALFPPYRIGGAVPRGLGYHFIGTSMRGSVDIYRWFIQYVALATVAGIAFWVAGSVPASEKPFKGFSKTLMLCLAASGLLVAAAVMLYFYL